MRSHIQFGSTLLCLVTVCLLLALSAEPAQAGFRHTIGTMLKVTQVRPVSKDDENANKKLSKSVLRALRRKFGYTKYAAYKLETREAREAGIGKDEFFALLNNTELTLRVVGYKPSTKLVDLKVQTSEDIRAVTVRSGRHLILSFDEEQGPLIIVITVRLLQIER